MNFAPNIQNLIRRFTLIVLIIAILTSFANNTFAQRSADKESVAAKKEIYPGRHWQEAEDPTKLGWSVAGLKKVQQFTKTLDTTAVVIVDDGVIVSQWGDTAIKSNGHSMRKSFISALYGTLSKDQLDLNATMKDLKIDDNEPKLTDVEKQARVIDLLKARSGVYHPALYETEGMKARKPKRGSHPPRSFWYYNNWDFNALGTIFEKTTGSKIGIEFNERIAEPIEMEHFTVPDVKYFTGEDSIHPSYPFHMSARDCARFGLLFMRCGKWNDKQIIPAEWVKESTTSYSVAEGDEAYSYSGYGYLWWVAVNGNHYPNVEVSDGTFSARGNHGQHITVMPKEKLVIVHRVNGDRREEKQVSNSDFGKVVDLILKAKGIKIGKN